MKAEILRKGTIEIDESGQKQPKGWCFDCGNGAAAISVDEDGVKHGGYTVDELEAISIT